MRLISKSISFLVLYSIKEVMVVAEHTSQLGLVPMSNKRSDLRQRLPRQGCKQ